MLFCEIITDIFFVLLAQIPWACIVTRARPFRRGFFCDDQTLMYPFKDSTVNRPGLICINMLIPIITMFVLEFVLSGIYRRKKTDEEADRTKSLFFRFFFKALCMFFIGYAVNEGVTATLKFVIGRLRPNFFDVCRPNYTRPCTHQRYYAEYPCQATNLQRIRDARLSFPSLHATSCMYSMVFIALYLHLRARLCRLQSFKVFFEAMFILIALYVGVTRISDYKNHWSDVLAGFGIGALFGTIFANCAVNNVYSYLDRKVLPRTVMVPATPDDNQPIRYIAK